jgi:esterase/lipase
LIIKYFIELYYINQNFKRLEKYFPRTEQWEKDLNIYKVALPVFNTSCKKNKCVLLISGYGDIPYVWDKIIKKLKVDNIDFYAPRTQGFGRSYFQYSDPSDWIITYLEAMKILENQYNEVNIIALSAGCIIALYISQFKYNCKINNIILCSPFLLDKQNIYTNIIFNSNLSQFIIPIIDYIIPYRINTPAYGYKYARGCHNSVSGETDFYNIIGWFKIDKLLYKFKDLRPTNIFANNILILYANDDQVIGNIVEQHNIIYNIYKKDITVIQIPNNSNVLCGHVIIKESSEIIDNLYNNIIKYLQ